MFVGLFKRSSVSLCAYVCVCVSCYWGVDFMYVYDELGVVSNQCVAGVYVKQ